MCVVVLPLPYRTREHILETRKLKERRNEDLEEIERERIGVDRPLQRRQMQVVVVIGHVGAAERHARMCRGGLFAGDIDRTEDLFDGPSGGGSLRSLVEKGEAGQRAEAALQGARSGNLP